MSLVSKDIPEDVQTVAEALGSPQPATVIAIGLRARLDDKPSLPATQRIFANLLGGTLAHTCHIQPASSHGEALAYTAIVPDTSQSLALLRRLLSVQDEIRNTLPDTVARFVVHHGLVFASGNNFIGSALRSAHSRLARLPRLTNFAATTDFAAYTESWAAHPITFHKLPEAQEGLGLLAFSLTSPNIAENAESLVDEGTLLVYLTKRLATHIGPFAEVLVDAARRSSTTQAQLIEELASEIDDPKARQEFRCDTQAFLATLAP